MDARNIDGSTPLCDACASGSVECVKLLLSYGAKVNPPLYTASPLHEACMSGESGAVRAGGATIAGDGLPGRMWLLDPRHFVLETLSSGRAGGWELEAGLQFQPSHCLSRCHPWRQVPSVPLTRRC